MAAGRVGVQTASAAQLRKDQRHDDSLVRHRPLLRPGSANTARPAATTSSCGTGRSPRPVEVVGDLTADIRTYDIDALEAALEPGDIAVSMLPADQHVGIAERCLKRGAHFVSSSYIAPEMHALDGAFREQGLVSVNEVGLDPGIDHLMAHDLVARYRTSAAYDIDNVLSFTSYCGGVPKIPNDVQIQVQLGAARCAQGFAFTVSQPARLPRTQR